MGKGIAVTLHPYVQVTKIGRDAVLYVESLIESIMGGLEGLINILDSEGGFGALEIQVTTCTSYFVTNKSRNSCCSLYLYIVCGNSSFFQSRQLLI